MFRVVSITRASRTCPLNYTFNNPVWLVECCIRSIYQLLFFNLMERELVRLLGIVILQSDSNSSPTFSCSWNTFEKKRNILLRGQWSGGGWSKIVREIKVVLLAIKEVAVSYVYSKLVTSSYLAALPLTSVKRIVMARFLKSRASASWSLLSQMIVLWKTEQVGSC